MRQGNVRRHREKQAAPSVEGHPPTYTVREERILAAVDTWLTELVDNDHLDATVAAILAAIRAGMDPDLAVPETKKIQAELAQLTAIIENSAASSDQPTPLTEAEVRAALTEAGGLIQLLGSSGCTDRAEMYRALGLTLRYEKQLQPGRNESTPGCS